ncbi:LytR family transcriptional regulator [Bacillus timonensis]|uniref:Polyisoprenyl-teichoic acid--peptidoglycan teichoic acid transferase TagU n=1 Tax=Bacillus timonensis TaxID=1033734 RepID=A0A4S3PPE1_9BACI|nr:LytR family transcriptional regulator [Bacillus timonensis]THE11338.1 LytR family transcriptional regulator [Bacillus timonensis]
MGRHNKKMNKKKKWLVWILSILGVLIIGIGGYAFYLYQSVEKAVSSMHTPIEREKSEKRTEQIDFGKKHPFSVLLLGVDEREGDRGRSDTLIVLTINPHVNSIKMLSIPRDTRTEIIGKGTQDKINHAYAFGGVEMTINTVENFLDIPIDYFVEVNMESFKDIVNAVGGVTVNNPFAFTFEGHTFKKGTIKLNGEEALAYSRMRKEDPRGDFGRQDRQRQIIQAVIKQGASLSTITKVDDILGVLGNNVQTNLTFNQMLEIQKNYKSTAGNLEQLQLTGSGTKIGGIYYFFVPKEELTKLSSQLKQHLSGS